MRLGLAAMPLDFFVLALVEELSALGALALPAAADLALLEDAGVNPLFIPRRPRFMILAGVTGVNCIPLLVLPLSPEVAKLLLLLLLLLLMLLLLSGEPDDEGGAGGGMLKSTGDGVSPGTSTPPAAMLPLLERVDLNSGVEFVDRDPLGIFRAMAGAVGRIAGDCLLREGFSSPLEEAVRLRALEEVEAVGCWFAAPSQGLVSGETSKSKSEGAAAEKAMCAGAEVDPRAGYEAWWCWCWWAWWWGGKGLRVSEFLKPLWSCGPSEKLRIMGETYSTG